MITGTITRRVSNVRNEMFRSFYTKKDFENGLKKLYEAMGSSAKYSIIANIVSMFEAVGVECKKDGDYEYYKNLVASLEINEPEGLEDKILAFLYSHFEEYPKPEDYMQRLVNRLSFPEDKWDGDTLRLRILKQFIKYGNFLSDIGYGGKNFIIAYVAEKTKKSEKEISVKMALESVDDEIFDKYEDLLKTNSDKELRKPKGPVGLLRLSNDLAKGRFKAGGATRKELYLFAMVYNMTFYSGEQEEIFDYERDLEKNLFEDYYNNNVMRFISKEYLKNNGALELDVSGQSINYKNFSEIIYVYFISKSYYSGLEKIIKSDEMIERVKQRSKGKTGKSNRDYNYTINAKDIFLDSLLSKSELDFENFVFENYECNVESAVSQINGQEIKIDVAYVKKGKEQLKGFQNQLKEIDLTEQINNIFANFSRLQILKTFLNYANCFEKLKYGGYSYIMKKLSAFQSTIDEYLQLIKRKKELTKKSTTGIESEEERNELFESIIKIEELEKTEIILEFIKLENNKKDLERIKRKKALDNDTMRELNRIKQEIKKLKDKDLISKYLKDDIFEECFRKIESAKSSKKSDVINRYKLLVLANNLSMGRFQMLDHSRSEFFLFAIVYGIGHNLNGNSDLNNCIKKINNLLCEANTNIKSYIGKDEIDYSDYKELVYTYYILKDDLTIEEKLTMSSEMINEIEVKALDNVKENKAINSESKETLNYDVPFIIKVMKKNREEFIEFILNKYNCDLGEISVITKGNMQVSLEQETAFKVYREIIERLDLSYCNYGLWFSDISIFDISDINDIRENEKRLGAFAKLLKAIGTTKDSRIEIQKLKDFLTLLKNINAFVGNNVTESKSSQKKSREHAEVSVYIPKGLLIDSSDKMTRTALMIAYYYDFNSKHELLKTPMTLTEVYEEYTNNIYGLNSYLDEAHYQPISDKSIFDIVMIFSSYAYLSGKI